MQCLVRCFSPRKKPTASNDGSGDGSGPSQPPRPTAGARGGKQDAAGDLPEFEGVRKFTIDELADSTKRYANANYLGQGSSGRVFKGSLLSGESVAIKILDKHSKEGVHGVDAFITEVSVLSKTDHPNIVKMLGICTERDEMLLVYEYMPRGSLAKCVHELHDREETLDWNTRVKIATETARGLLYLHETSNPQIIHRDLKPENILLDNEFNTKLGDFGIATFAPVRGEAFGAETNIGTFGYSCPEYIELGRICDKTDIFSFGIILLELLTGRAAKAPGKQLLLQWARNFLDDPHKVTQIADPSLEGRYPKHVFGRLAEIASKCTANKQDARPPIRDVIAVLEDVASQPYLQVLPEGGDDPSCSAPTT